MMSTSGEYRIIPLEKLRVSPFNVRSRLIQANVKRLAENISEVGLLEPLVVAPSSEPGVYEVVVGRHRLEALKLLRSEEPELFQRMFKDGIPCIVKKLSPSEAIMISLTENLQRGDLTREEVGMAVQRLVTEYRVPIEEIVKQVRVEMKILEEALEAVRLIREIGATLSRPGRPPKKRRRKAVPRIAVRAAMRLSEELMEKGLTAEKAEEVKNKLLKAAAEAGLSGKEIEIVTRKAEEELSRNKIPDIDALVKSIRAHEKMERIVLLDKKVMDAVSTLAEQKGRSFDEMLEEVVRQGLKNYGIKV